MPPEFTFKPSDISIHANGFKDEARLKRKVTAHIAHAKQTAFLGQALFDALTPYVNKTVLAAYHRGGFDAQSPLDMRYLVIPLYGPLHRHGVVFLSNIDDLEKDSEALHTLQSRLQTLHQRYAEMWETPERFQITLSEREHEVLTWLAAGKSNLEISSIIGLSPHTVDAYIRRVFSKLSANNRVSASTKALGLGLLNETVVHMSIGSPTPKNK